jgi:hypothetical protein
VIAALVDARHDVLEHLLELFFLPRTALGILAHFEARDRDAAGVGRLARRDRAAWRRLKTCTPARSVGMLAPSDTAMQPFLTRVARVVAEQLVLRGAGQRHVAGHAPGRLAGVKVVPGKPAT